MSDIVALSAFLPEPTGSADSAYKKKEEHVPYA